jgi:hypothetical protein
MRNNTTTRIGLTNISQDNSRVTQYHTLHDKSPTQQEPRGDDKKQIQHDDKTHLVIFYEQQKQLVDLFLLPYYNIETLTDDINHEQECAICFEPFYQQDIVARLECLCIYHKQCLDEWGRRKRCCPLHMDKMILTHKNKFRSSTELEQE